MAIDFWLMELRPTSHSSLASIARAPELRARERRTVRVIETSRIRLASSGKIPTTSARRPISRLKRSSGFVLLSFGQLLGRKRAEREHVGLGLLEHGGDPRQPPLELRDRVAQALEGLGAVRSGEEPADERVVLVFPRVVAEIAQE